MDTPLSAATGLLNAEVVEILVAERPKYQFHIPEMPL
jgi:hypothetical protein